MELTRFFKNLSKENVNLAGGKGASLGEMTRAGIPVPNGFVILSDSFEKFLEETDLNVELDAILDKVNHKEMQSIENASEEIKALKRQFASLITKEDLMLVTNMLRFKASQGNKKAKKLLERYLKQQHEIRTDMAVRESILNPPSGPAIFDSPD